MAGEYKVEFQVGDGDEDPVDVDLTFDRVVCPRHGEPFREQWPLGFPTFSVTIFEDLTKNETFQEHVGASTKLINETLDYSPICERVSKPSLIGAYLLSGIGKEAICVHCGEMGYGTSYKTAFDQFNHLCFQCVVYRLEHTN